MEHEIQKTFGLGFRDAKQKKRTDKLKSKGIYKQPPSHIGSSFFSKYTSKISKTFSKLKKKRASVPNSVDHFSDDQRFSLLPPDIIEESKESHKEINFSEASNTHLDGLYNPDYISSESDSD